MEIELTISWPKLYPGIHVRYFYAGSYHDKSHQDDFSKSIIASKSSDQSSLFRSSFEDNLRKIKVAPDLVIPVPSSHEVPSPTVDALARLAADFFKATYSSCLRKKPGSVKLSTLKGGYKERYDAVKGSILLNHSLLGTARTVLLIDDIKSTGLTTMECAKMLKESGVHTVVAVFIARNVPHRPVSAN
jgi:predicted amidophosphoribosyltransferase